MPITYQRLGNSGGGMVLTIHALPNKQVTLRNQKDGTSKIRITNATGEAVFKQLKKGTYTIITTGVNGGQVQQEVILSNEFDEVLRIGQIKDLPLKSKVKLSSGKTFIVQAKNVSGHDSNSTTLVSEYIIEKFTSSGSLYPWAQDFEILLNKYYDELSDTEKKCVFKRRYRCLVQEYQGTGHGYEDKFYNDDSYFWCLSISEVGGTWSDSGANLGYHSAGDRAKTHNNGTEDRYWLRDGYSSSSDYDQMGVDKSGNIIEISNINVSPKKTAGIVVGCDVKNDAYVALDSDGYYRILGM